MIGQRVSVTSNQHQPQLRAVAPPMSRHFRLMKFKCHQHTAIAYIFSAKFSVDAVCSSYLRVVRLPSGLRTEGAAATNCLWKRHTCAHVDGFEASYMQRQLSWQGTITVHDCEFASSDHTKSLCMAYESTDLCRLLYTELPVSSCMQSQSSRAHQTG